MQEEIDTGAGALPKLKQQPIAAAHLLNPEPEDAHNLLDVLPSRKSETAAIDNIHIGIGKLTDAS